MKYFMSSIIILVLIYTRTHIRKTAKNEFLILTNTYPDTTLWNTLEVLVNPGYTIVMGLFWLVGILCIMYLLNIQIDIGGWHICLT